MTYYIIDAEKLRFIGILAYPKKFYLFVRSFFPNNLVGLDTLKRNYNRLKAQIRVLEILVPALKHI